MKKNVVGHMLASKEPVSAKMRRWSILPRLVCLLLALMIWLAVTNLRDSVEKVDPSDPANEVTEQSAE